MNADVSRCIHRLAFPLAAALSAYILFDLHRQGYASDDLFGYGAILFVILCEYGR